MEDILELKEIPIEEAEFAVLDFETTGTSAKYGRVIEVGLVHVKNLEIKDTYRTFINPGVEIPYQITLLTGITNDDVFNAPYFDEVAENIESFIGSGSRILTAHNLRFDQSFLEYEYGRCGKELTDEIEKLCTLQLARKLYPSLPSKSLGNLVKRFRITHKNVHRALGDATVTAKLLVKMINDVKEDYHLETVGELINFSKLPRRKTYKILKKKLADDYSSLPDHPGVYFFSDKNENVIYVGKAKSIKGRVQNYFASTAPAKSKRIVRSAQRLGFQKTNTELTALLTESELIKKHKPRLNTLLKKYSNSYFIKVNKAEPFPRLKTTEKFDFDGNDYFGPFSRRDSAKTILEIIDRSYKLRECTNKEFSKKKKCYLADIERCIAPCVEKNINIYSDEIENVYRFFNEGNEEVVGRLAKKMKDLSDKQKFEEAAIVRDTINMILAQIKRIAVLSEPVNSANALIVVKFGPLTDYILIIEGRVYIKDFGLDVNLAFESAVNDYYEGNVQLFQKSEKKDLERMKIILGWISFNFEQAKIYYLKNFESAEELFFKINNT